MLRKLIRFANHPIVLTFSGIFLAISGLIELEEAVLTFEGGIKGEHGIVLFGIMSALKGLGELGEAEEGLLLTQEGRREHKKAQQKAEEENT